MKLKIKQNVNNKVNAFVFHYDLCQSGVLAKILSQFRIDGLLYFCFYGIDDPTVFLNVVHDDSKCLKIEKIDRCSFAVAISSEELGPSVAMYMKMSEETVVWSEFIDWSSYIQSVKESAAGISHKKRQVSNNNPALYLDFEKSESNRVTIISDLDFKGTAAVTVDSIRSCLN